MGQLLFDTQPGNPYNSSQKKTFYKFQSNFNSFQSEDCTYLREIILHEANIPEEKQQIE
jgi:hypothetical protein